ncbi:MAG: hypothetical protein QMC85_05750 [Methanocellales archaeon]|nr:hypothetical protein [Methanocellales archaeon]
MIEIVVPIKILACMAFFIALMYAVKNYGITKQASNVWLFISLAMGTAFVLTFTRAIKAFWWLDEFEIIKTHLIPIVVVFLLVAAANIRRDVLKPI